MSMESVQKMPSLEEQKQKDKQQLKGMVAAAAGIGLFAAKWLTSMTGNDSFTEEEIARGQKDGVASVVGDSMKSAYKGIDFIDKMFSGESSFFSSLAGKSSVEAEQQPEMQTPREEAPIVQKEQPVESHEDLMANWIRQSREGGKTNEELAQELLASGWKMGDVIKALG